MTAVAVAVPLGASAGNSKVGASPHTSITSWLHKTYVSPVLTKHARRHPNSKMRVIVQADSRFVMTHRVEKIFRAAGVPRVKKLKLIGAAAVDIRARYLTALSKIKGLTVTPDAPVKVSGYNSTQLWPYQAGLAKEWMGPDAPSAGQAPTIAVVDSGVQADRPDFANGGVVGSINLSTLPNTEPGARTGAATERSWPASPRVRQGATRVPSRRRTSSRSRS